VLPGGFGFLYDNRFERSQRAVNISSFIS